MSGILDIPELQALASPRGLVRIPPETDVPLTPRVRAILDSAPFRRLAQISQLGLVSLVYPAAHHTRFEHALGVYRLALVYLRQLAHDERFQAVITPADARLLIAAALLHDIGHWPFCHPIEDLRLPGVPEHESLAREFLAAGELAEILRRDWQIDPQQIISLLAEKPTDTRGRILDSILSGPIDIDKMDYLGRDSLHAGVPYGRNFDQQRLVGSLCLNEAGDGLALTEKGRTAAEMMVFARYVMFSEVYWHHAVRSATAMLQRAFYLLHDQLPLAQLFRLTQQPMIDRLLAAAAGQPAAELLDGLFGPRRLLYKRLAQLSLFQEPETYQLLARKPYPWLAACSAELAARVRSQLGIDAAPHELLLDAPPVGLEVEFKVQIHFPKEGKYRWLGEVSPVVQALASRQFDDYVKRVRLFAHPRVAKALRKEERLLPLLAEAARATDSGSRS